MASTSKEDLDGSNGESSERDYFSEEVPNSSSLPFFFKTNSSSLIFCIMDYFVCFLVI